VAASATGAPKPAAIDKAKQDATKKRTTTPSASRIAAIGNRAQLRAEMGAAIGISLAASGSQRLERQGLRRHFNAVGAGA
jgi:hypothetical protein